MLTWNHNSRIPFKCMKWNIHSADVWREPLWARALSGIWPWPDSLIWKSICSQPKIRQFSICMFVCSPKSIQYTVCMHINKLIDLYIWKWRLHKISNYGHILCVCVSDAKSRLQSDASKQLANCLQSQSVYLLVMSFSNLFRLPTSEWHRRQSEQFWHIQFVAGALTPHAVHTHAAHTHSVHTHLTAQRVYARSTL